ncbi:restriction endonuclease [Streptomyces caniscabiei]|uniref:restriction endonuclease n=1 Tax=Streptomyces caniscabiei TaxID=2746961 RepID=UPI0038F6B880
MLEICLEKAKSAGFEVREMENGFALRIPCSPATLFLQQITSEVVYAAIYLRTTSWEWNGERSDLHDAFSTVIAAYFAVNEVASCGLRDVPHPAGAPEGEVYARFITFDQPGGGYFNVAKSTRELEEVIATLYSAELFLHSHLPMHPEMKDPATPWDSVEKWQNEACRALGEAADSIEDAFGIRESPEWAYYRCASEDVSVFRSRQMSKIFHELAKASEVKNLQGITGHVQIRGVLQNYVAEQKVDRAERILHELGEDGAPQLATTIALENSLIFPHGELTILTGSESGRGAFEKERNLVLPRHRDEVDFLFRGVTYEWASSVDGGRFQELVQDLLEREPGVISVRSVGNANEGDGGRDHLVDWFTPIQDDNVTVDNAVNLTRKMKVVVQCKALKASIGKSKIPDILDTLDREDATGYLLAASGSVGVTAIDHLLHLRKKYRFFTDWWSRHEIEVRLQRNPDVENKYPDIVKRVLL